MTNQGNLNSIGIDDNSLLKQISNDALTGRLSIFYENEKKRNVQDVIFIDKGYVIGVKSLERYALRELLLYAGKITKSQLLDADTEAKNSTSPKTPEQVLLEKGIISREIIVQSIATLIRGCVQRILTKPYGLYIFHQCDQLKGVKPMTRLGFRQVILDYCRAVKHSPNNRKSEILNPNNSIRIKADIEEIKKKFHLTEKEWKVIISIGSESEISKVINDTQMDGEQLDKIIYTLRMVDLIEVALEGDDQASNIQVEDTFTPEPAVVEEPVVEEDAEPKARLGSILVVDDSKTIQKMVQLALEGIEYELVMADDGFMALEKAQQEKPELVILDVIMPKLDGYKTCVQLKKIFAPEKVPVIMLTARDGTFDKIKGRLAGASMYMAKPFEAAELRASVEKYLSGSN